LKKKEIHKRPSFEPWVPVDVMNKDDREAVFRTAKTRELPIVYIDDVPFTMQQIFDFEKTGELDKKIKFADDKKRKW